MKKNLATVVNDRARRITIRGKTALVPLKFDKNGNPATVDKLIFKRLSLRDLRFLQIWREADWDIDVAVQKSALPQPDIERLVKRLSCFREEDARVKALCEIPTPAWIAAKHVENFYEGGRLEESQHKSLQELAKIEGAYKQESPTTQITVFNLPPLTPAQEAQLKPVFDTMADDGSHAAA